MIGKKEWKKEGRKVWNKIWYIDTYNNLKILIYFIIFVVIDWSCQQDIFVIHFFALYIFFAMTVVKRGFSTWMLYPSLLSPSFSHHVPPSLSNSFSNLFNTFLTECLQIDCVIKHDKHLWHNYFVAKIFFQHFLKWQKNLGK